MKDAFQLTSKLNLMKTMNEYELGRVFLVKLVGCSNVVTGLSEAKPSNKLRFQQTNRHHRP
jgi:hypothetical protein